MNTKLTDGDIQELRWFFSTPSPVNIGAVAAQTYEPGGGYYDPYRDERLVKLVLHVGRAQEKSEWHRVKRVLDELRAAHVRILRHAFSPTPIATDVDREFGFGEVAVRTTVATGRGRARAVEEEHRRLVEAAFEYARRDGASGPTVAGRVWESERRILKQGIRVTESDVLHHARRVLEQSLKNKIAESEFIVAVKLETKALLEAAGEAYREMRARLGATRRKATADAERARGEALARDLGAKRRQRAPRRELQEVCDLVTEMMAVKAS